MRLTNYSNQRFVLNTEEIAVTANQGQIVCYGLGSCIGLFLYDKFQRVAAGAHIMLPGQDAKHPSCQMLETMISIMLRKGCHIPTIRAKIVGGADVMNIKGYQIGQRNIEFSKRKLKEKGILLQAEDVGGRQGRTAKLDVESGLLHINDSKRNYYTI